MNLLAKVGLVIIFAVLISCDGDSVSPNADSFFSNRYYANTGQRLSYQSELISSFIKDDGSVSDIVMIRDTITIAVSGDTLVDGHRYREVRRLTSSRINSLVKIVRSYGSKYFERTYRDSFGFDNEILFLDTDVPEHGSWSTTDLNGYKTDYVVMSKDTTLTINKVEYQNVIIVSVGCFAYDSGVGDYILYNKADHYYARGIGEIYSYIQYPVSGFYGDVRLTLLPGNK